MVVIGCVSWESPSLAQQIYYKWPLFSRTRREAQKWDLLAHLELSISVRKIHYFNSGVGTNFSLDSDRCMGSYI